MIKWAIIAVLIAGSVGFLWTAPWKDEVDSIRATVRDAAGVLNDATSGECARIADKAKEQTKDAVAGLVRAADDDPAARSAAREQADKIAECIRQLPREGSGWREIYAQLRAAGTSP